MPIRQDEGTRIKRLPVEDWDPGLRDLVPVDELSPLERATLECHAHRPPTITAILGLQFAFAGSRLLPARLHELVRLRIAFFNQCRSCMAMRAPSAVADGLTEELVCSLERPAEAPDLTDAERAALHYAELFATDHLAIDMAVYEGLREHFSEAEIVELGHLCAYFVGFGRLAATFNIIEELPDHFREAEIATPWSGSGVATAVKR